MKTLHTTRRAATTANRTPRPTPAQKIAAIIVPATFDLAEALDDEDALESFERLRDSIRGRKHSSATQDICDHETAIKAALPESERLRVVKLSDAYTAEEMVSMRAAFQVGIEVGKRMVQR